MNERAQLKFQLLDVKNEIEKTKLVISSIKCDICSATNKKRTQKLKGKRFYMERKLRELIIEKNKLEKIFKGERREEF